ncbi:phage tail tape measure protein [Rhodococcus sp. UNC363MFTsu5.1]|uniref:phage tail tape measure protein n=1 Tax=Rhodococcus sp. UNC363MFTsu5.1 TaxID=1449069 RepID=UPI00048994B8|nr:phage tail tape measure protein [Rhodococcus sp. UNC363MFTsu5.1]
METIGWAALQIIPAMRGVEGQMTGQLAGPMKSAGQRAGKDAGDAIAAGLAAAKGAVDKAATDLAKSQDKVADAAGKVRVAEAALLELREKGITDGARLTRATEALESARRKEAATTRDAEAAAGKLADAQKRATDAADDGAGKVSRFGGAFDGFGGKVKSGADDLGKFAIAAAGIGGAVALGMQAFDNMDVESKLAAQLGATGDLAAKYGDQTGNLWKQGVAGSMDEAAAAIGAVATTFTWAGAEGEKATDQIAASALNFSKVFGTDVNEAVQATSQLVTNGLAKDSTEAFDLMTTAFQRVSPAMRDELPEILNEYGTNFRALGFDGEEAFDVLVSAADKGKFALDKTGDALKEFTIRGSDMSKASAEAYKAIGLDAEDMSNMVAMGGKDAQNALQETAKGLLNIEMPADRANAAIALFGTPLEDLSVDQIPMFLEGLTGAEDRMAGFAGSSQQMSDTLNSGPNHAMTQLKNTIQGGLTDALGSIATWMMDNQGPTQAMAIALGLLAAGFVTYKAVLIGQQAATVIATASQWALNAAMTANPIGAIIVAVTALVAGLVWFFTQTELGQQIVTGAWNAIKAGWDWMWNAVSVGIDAFGAGLGWIGTKAGEAKDWVVGKFDELVGFVTGLPGRIGSAASGMWDGITNAFKSALNWVIQRWNSFRLSFDFTIPVINKRIQLSLDTPDLPLLRDGGTIAGRTADGQLWGPGDGRSDSIVGVNAAGIPVVRVADGEGIVREDVMSNGGAAIVAALNAGQLTGLKDGGVIGSLTSLAAERFPALQVTDTLRPGANDFHGAGKAVDFSNGSGNTDEELGFANFLADHYQSQLRELIYDDPRFNRQIKDGQIVPDSFYAAAGDHTNHVHAAADEPLAEPKPLTPEVITVAPGQTGPAPGWGPTGPGALGPGTSTTTTTTPTTEVEKTFSARDRWKSMFTDVAGVWADASTEIFGLGDWLDLADRYTIKAGSTTSTSTTANPALPGTAGQMPGVDLPTSAMESAIDPNAAPQAGPGGRAGADLYAYEIARAASEKGLGEAAAVIGEATALVEAGDPLKMWANNAVPESLSFPHDAVGSDYDSVGLFQQRNNGAWGTVAQRMSAFDSALMFFEQFPADWQSMDPGAVAQSVQRSAFPAKYGQMLGRGQALVDETGLFDNGGWLMPGQLGFNGLTEPEPILEGSQWRIAEANINKVDELVGAGAGVGGGGPRVQIINNNHQTIADQASWQRDQAERQSIAILRYGGGNA